MQVELVGLSYIGLSAVVDFLYSGELPLDGGNIDYVLEAAHLLQVKKKWCSYCSSHGVQPIVQACNYDLNPTCYNFMAEMHRGPIFNQNGKKVNEIVVIESNNWL